MVSLRKATMEDMDLLYKWANDTTVRENSFNTEPIPYENHIKWFNKMMNDESVLQFILMEDDTPVGQIRLNIEASEAEIGYSIAADYRGHGYGHQILQLVKSEVKNHYPEIKTLVAKVKPDNVASNKLFQKEGYETQYYCYTSKI